MSETLDPRYSQFALPLVDATAQEPDVEMLVTVLDGHDWRTATDLAAMAQGALGKVWTDRYIRALAAASAGRVAGSNRGYKLVKQMTEEEFKLCIGRMTHQASEMKKRAAQMQEVFDASRS